MGVAPITLAFEVPPQIVFDGVVKGFTYGVLAIGLILVYRSTRVINFAHGEIGAFAAGLLAILNLNYGWNFFLALATALAVGGIIGGVVELGVVRRLRDAPRVILFVATIGVAQLVLVAHLYLPKIETFTGYPTPFSSTWEVGGVRIQSDQLLVLIVVPLITVALALFLGRTRTGMAIRASAANPDAAQLNAIRIKQMSTLVWVLSGVIAAMSLVLIAPLRVTNAADTVFLGNALLLRALAAGLVGRMRNMPIALAAGTAIGVIESLLFFNIDTDPGRIDALLLVIILITVLVIATSERGTEDGGWSFSAKVRPIPANLADEWWARYLPRIGSALALLVAIALPFVLSQASQQFLYARMLLYAAIAVSLVVLTGWSGQLSLGQFALVGVGAMSAVALVEAGVSYEVAVVLCGVIGFATAAAIGAPALRLRGLFLAITTLAFAVMAENWLLTRSIFVGDNPIVTLPRAYWGDSFSLESQQAFYFVSLGFLVLVIIAALRVRRSGIGRSMVAVRENEEGAAAFTISPTRIKLIAFGMGGAIAGMAGALLAGLLVTFDETAFAVEESLRIVSIAVIGGLTSVAGAVLGALWVIGLPAALSDSQEVALLTSGIGLLVLLLYFPGGLIQIANTARDALFEVLSKRRPEVVLERSDGALPAHVPGRLHDDGPESVSGGLALRTERLTVRFGERAVVQDVSLEVEVGEIVGLIGANGAGKSTFMNGVGGFVPSDGEVSILGKSAGSARASKRAAMGVGRAFQNADLFGDLTVRETVMTALEGRERTGLTGVLLGLPGTRRAERAKRAQADELVAFFGLGRYADTFVNELSTGTRRIVELTCLVGLDARLLCLDEPTAGVAQRETEAFGPLILRLREELSCSMLVIEHDMPLVMSISDRVYCLEAGQVIAEGLPDAVRTDPAVVSSYLGTDERAIHRSGTAAD